MPEGYHLLRKLPLPDGEPDRPPTRAADRGGSFGGDERRRQGEPAETPFPPTEVGDRGTQMLAGEIGP
jgi:hypothetical protein